MKKLFLTFLVSLLVLPALIPWVPDSVLQSFHVQQELHHGISSDQGDAGAHNHDGHVQQSVHHSIHFDVVTYFSDYLHVDLQSPNQHVLAAPSQDAQDIDFTLAVDALPQRRYELASMQSRAPPDWRSHRPENTPPHFLTQRLRI